MRVFIGYPSFMAYQMMKGKKDNNDGFPSIPGTIARYSSLGLTNEEMSKNPVWVDDKVQSSSFTMNEDWTIVGDWELLSNVQINCGIVKAQNVYLYNIANGLLISINNPRSLQSLGTKSLHAICSDGRLYDRNWVEYEYTVDQNFAIVESSLNIGFNLNNYTQIAFKNLGIYNNQILSKDDCIKAYNYLQTLKAK